MKVVIPNLYTKHALSFSNELYAYAEDDSYFFDVSNISNYEPFTMLFTSAVIRQFCQSRAIMPWDMRLLYKDNKDYAYACHMGYFKAAGFAEGKKPGEAFGSSSYIPLTKLNMKDLYKESLKYGGFYNDGEVIELKSAELARILAQNNEEMRKLLQFLIREAIRNIPEHAETNDIWICGQYWSNRDFAEIAILDEGIGVYESLNKNAIHKRYIKDNDDALRWALKPGVSCSFDPSKEPNNKPVWSNSGFGLHMISEICRSTEKGWCTFASNDNCLRIYGDKIDSKNITFHGTAIGIRVGTKDIKNAQAMIDAARLKGEATALNIKNAFKSASIPSRGLIIK